MILQFAEGLSDRQAAEAVRGRLDWKYLLALELTDPGFDFSVLGEFRSRLLEGGTESLLLRRPLEECRDQKPLKARGRQRTDSTRVIAAIRAVNRLERVAEPLHAAYNPDRLHSTIGYLSPVDYEDECHSHDHSQSEKPHSPVAA